MKKWCLLVVCSVVGGVQLHVLGAMTQKAREWEKNHPCPGKPHPRIIPPLQEVPDADGMNALFMKFSPVIYLDSEETAFPIDPLEYVENRNNALIDKKTGKTILNAADGSLTAKSLDEYTRHLWSIGIPEQSSYINIPPCVLAGSNPYYWRDMHNNLTTPASFMVFRENGKIYIQCFFLYGYNSPYDIVVFNRVFVSGDKYEFQNAHECDLEHITLEIDPIKMQVIRVFYGAHGSAEGMWVNWSDVEKESLENGKKPGTHLVNYAAKGGHGNYPRAGEFVRIYSFGDDKTGKGIRWTPTWMRIYPPKDATYVIGKGIAPYPKGYDPATMGWINAPGSMGKRGVDGAAHQWWFGSAKNEGNRTFQEGMKDWCPRGDWKCIMRKAPYTVIPGGIPQYLELAIQSWKMAVESGMFLEDVSGDISRGDVQGFVKDVGSQMDRSVKNIKDTLSLSSQIMWDTTKDIARDINQEAQKTIVKAGETIVAEGKKSEAAVVKETKKITTSAVDTLKSAGKKIKGWFS